VTSILIKNIQSLAGIRSSNHVVKGAAMKQLPAIDNAYLLTEGDSIRAFGPMQDCPERAGTVIDATGRFVLPAWCDPHTHIVYAGSRENEFIDKINGLTYEEIAARGGGILNSANRLNNTGEQELYESAAMRLAETKAFGTGAIEIKSGYGLSVEGELKMLRVIRRLKETSGQLIKATFLGAHAIPAAYKTRREEYVKLLTEDLLPRIAGEGLADFIDVFCDKGFFTPDETARILEAGARYGLEPKIHANELDYSGGIETGVQYKARSVDHLEFTGTAQIEALLQSDTMPTLLPSTAFFLRLHYAPARNMIDAGLPVALATDFNPGSSPSGNMPFVLSLSCINMKMLPEEVINAATINSAYAMKVEQQAGSITIGKKANLIITKPMPSLAFIPYSFGSNPVEQLILNGRL
jgi:imidazolonepropionase